MSRSTAQAVPVYAYQDTLMLVTGGEVSFIALNEPNDAGLNRVRYPSQALPGAATDS